MLSIALALAIATAKPPLPGALLIADRGNDRIILVDPRHRVLWHATHLTYDDDAFVEPGGKAIVSNEEEGQRIVSIDIRTHARRTLYGIGIKGNGAGEVNTPDDAYVLPNGTMTVADAYNCRVLFVRARRIVRVYGRPNICRHNPPYTFGSVNGDTPLQDGGVLISEIQGSWIDDISAGGRLRWAVQAPVSYPSDPQMLANGTILLADYASPGGVLIMNRRGRVLWRYQLPSGWAALDHPSLAIMLPNGDIAVNDDFNDRVVIIDPRTKRIVWQYGSKNRPGTGFDRLHIPDGMDFVPLGPGERPLWAQVHHP